ncbi:MAG TPA: hypothetical protein VM925_06680 [Labilithrix sp.]|nr:hypothetical protein [Labilithrix sp.]
MSDEEGAWLAPPAPVDAARPSAIPAAARAFLARAFDRVLCGVAALLAGSLVVAGWHDVSYAYDVWYYHLPFAARLAGIMDANAYAFSTDNQARYEGFPLFGELLQGWLWRITGHVQATSFVSLGALFVLPFFLRRLFGVPIHLALLAFLAIPLVHIHATSSYVDLPANACATLLLLGVYRSYVANEPPAPRVLAGYGVLAAVTVNTKFQLVPIVVVASAALLVVSLRDLVGWKTATDTVRSGLKQRLVVFAVALPIVFATPIKNAAIHGNPVWPIELRVLGHSFPHAEEAYASSPRHLAGSPSPVRFVRSVLEIDNRPITTQHRWSLDQWTPPDEPGYRMGGFFGAYVVLNLAALGLAVWRRRSREATVAVALFGGATLVASVVPQSHELRYYLFWMLLLVSLNLVLWARAAPSVVGLAATASLVIVTWSTSGAYLYASGSTFAELLVEKVDPSVIESALPHERLCIERQPFTFLYAPTFHPRKDFSVQEAASEADCRGARRFR